MGSRIQPVDLHNCTYKQAFRQLVAIIKHLKFHTLLAHDDAVWVLYPVVCLSDGKSPLQINESSPGLIQTTKILSNLRMQDICNTKEDWRLLGLLLNVEIINREINPDHHQYFNIQGVEIDH
jgi:hypothetical protein